MTKLLEPGKQKLIDSKKIVSSDGNEYVYEIVVNAAVQKDAYEKLFEARKADTEIKGFRKGEAPRDMVEPQIYQEVSKDLVNLLVNYSVEELLAEESIIATSAPEVDKVDFAMVETPLKFTVKISKLPDYKLPDTKKLKVKAKEVEVTDGEMQQAKDNLWKQWEQKAKDEDKKKYSEMTDEWIEKEIGIPNVKDLKTLEELLLKELKHTKQHQEEDRMVNEQLQKAIDSMKIEVPKSVSEKSVEANMKAQEENFKKYGITFEDYLKHYNKTEEEYRKEVAEGSEKKFREDVFWTLFIRDRKIQIDPKDAKDVVFINYAASAMKVQPDAKLNPKQVETLIQAAAMYKAAQQFREEIGLVPHEEHGVEISDEVESNTEDKKKEEE